MIHMKDVYCDTHEGCFTVIYMKDVYCDIDRDVLL